MPGSEKHLFWILVLLELIPGVLCRYEYNQAGLVVAAVASVFCLLAIIALLFMVCKWNDWYRNKQLNRGRYKLPREEENQRGWLWKRKKQNGAMMLEHRPGIQQYKPKSLLAEEIAPAQASPSSYAINETRNPAMQTVITEAPQNVEHARPIQTNDNTMYVPINAREPSRFQSRQTQKVIKNPVIHVQAAMAPPTENRMNAGYTTAYSDGNAMYSSPHTARATSFGGPDVYFDDSPAVVNFEEEDDEPVQVTSQRSGTQERQMLY